MKVAILGSKDYDSLEFHINDSLTFLGHQVFHIDIKDLFKIPYRFNYWGMKFFPSYDKYTFSKVAKAIVEQNPDLVICTYRFIHPDCIEFIKNNLKNTKVIHVNPDQLTTLQHQQIFASPYDAYFTKDPFMVDFMKNKIKLNTFYLPESFNPRIHKTIDVDRTELENKTGIDVVCFGTMYPYRAKMVSELVKSGAVVTLFGTPDRRFPRNEIMGNFKNEFITGSRKAEVLLGSKIVFNNFHYAEIESANVKFFEIAGIGAFQICDYKPTLQEYTKIDVESFTFKSIDAAYDLIKYYIDKPELRYQLANEQREHFLDNHTYEHRINQIFQSL